MPRRILYFIAKVITTINCHVVESQREGVLANMRVILGSRATDKRVRRHTLATFHNYGKFIAEFFGYQRFGGLFIDQHVDVVGEEHLQEALAGGKGAIMNSGHLSNWEIGAAVLARRGYPLVGVALPHPDPVLDAYFNCHRRARGYMVVPTQGAYRKSMAVLKRNETVCFVGDRDVGFGGIEVEFFGRPTLLPQGPTRIALASGAPILPALVIRRPNDSFVLHIEPPLDVPTGGSRRRKGQIMTQAFARIVERYVRLFPTQWGVFYKVWPGEGETVDYGAGM
jgi:KDO2-lipid IV(A) lauroyltransferase